MGDWFLSREGQTIYVKQRINLPKHAVMITHINTSFFYRIASWVVHALRLQGTTLQLPPSPGAIWTSHIFLPQTTKPQDRAPQLSITKAQWVVFLRSAPLEKCVVPWASWGPCTTSYCWVWQHSAPDVPREKVTCRRHKTTCRNVGTIMFCWALGKTYLQSRYGLQCVIWVTLL